MKKDWSHLDAFRRRKEPYGSDPGDTFGAFFYPVGTDSLTIMATSGAEPGSAYAWEHVSVHARHKDKPRLPTWLEMCRVKDLFWDKDEVVMQLHPAEKDYVNDHAHVLHLWKPIGSTIPTPPPFLVGIGRK